MNRFASLILLVSFVIGSLVGAQELSEAPAYDEAKEAAIAQRAKKRLYPGGRDEEDLRVQNQLTTPIRKVAPQAEIKEEATEE
ncbi:MAG: hypothetical protein AAGB31_10575 [Bdellovibrio sp.]